MAYAYYTELSSSVSSSSDASGDDGDDNNGGGGTRECRGRRMRMVQI